MYLQNISTGGPLNLTVVLIVERLILFDFVAILGKGLFFFGHDQMLTNVFGSLRSVLPSASCVFSIMNPEGFFLNNSIVKISFAHHKIHLLKCTGEGYFSIIIELREGSFNNTCQLSSPTSEPPKL